MKFSSTVSLFLVLLLTQTASGQWWKQYPYHEEGTVLTFPRDEGFHPGNNVEWWYTTGHVTGDSTGTNYSYMLTYFYFPRDTFGLHVEGFRIFNIANDNTGVFQDETLPVTAYPTLSEDHLEIRATTGFPGLTHPEEWTTLKDSAGNLIPFEYHVKATQTFGSIDVTYRSVSRPLTLENGFFYQGSTGYTYYYSLTRIEITGTITFNGVTETVHGTGWIDRQWGEFNPFYGEKYEWFSIQLSNGMAMNVWNIFDLDSRIRDTSTYRLCSVLVDDSTDWELHDFEFTRLEFNWMPDSQRCFSKKWHLVDENIDIIMTALHTNSEVALPFRFFEGATTVTGTVNGQPVTGTGFAECLHSYEHPQVQLTSPTASSSWDGSQPFTWRLMNPDDGRPVYYDVEISTDNYVFSKIAQSITDTFFYWDPAGISWGNDLWLKVTGYSIDSSLTGTYRMSNSFSFVPTGIQTRDNFSLNIYPNPTDENFSVILPMEFKGTSELKIYNSIGVEVLKETIQIISEEPVQFNVDGLPPGTYLVSISAENSQRFGKILVVK